jgi:hypothetical protein
VGYLVSLAHFAWETMRRWWLSVVGVGFAALGVLQGGFGVSVSIPTPVAFGGAATTWFLAAGWAYHDLRKATATDAVWAALDPLMQEGAEILRGSFEADFPGDWQEQAEDWEARTLAALEQWTDATEATLFREAGSPAKWPTDLIRAKVKFLRDIQPKARAGHWR